MRLNWVVTKSDIAAARACYRAQRDNAFVKTRYARNVKGVGCRTGKQALWQAMVGCLLTTQQRSGPDSPVTRFQRSRPFPLSLSRCAEASDVHRYALKTLRRYGGIRRFNVVADQIATNFEVFQGADWSEIRRTTKALREKYAPEDERAAADTLSRLLHGLGPKQSRNMLQSVGLTRWEIPVDSRITKWLNREVRFPIRLTAGGLNDSGYYALVSEGFQALCRGARLYPCVLDAAIFSSFDARGWDEGDAVW